MKHVRGALVVVSALGLLALGAGMVEVPGGRARETHVLS